MQGRGDMNIGAPRFANIREGGFDRVVRPELAEPAANFVNLLFTLKCSYTNRIYLNDRSKGILRETGNGREEVASSA